MRAIASKALKTRQNFYAVLELEDNATTDNIKRRYAEMCTSIDITSEKFVKNDCLTYTMELLNEAYQVLSNPTKRKKYDQNIVRQ